MTREFYIGKTKVILLNAEKEKEAIERGTKLIIEMKLKKGVKLC